MLRSYLFMLLLVAISSHTPAAAQTAEVVPPEEISRLIRQLDAEEFKTRQDALIQLIQIGDAALAPLEAALADQNSSAELRIRAKEAVKQLRAAAIKRNAIKLSDMIKEARLARHDKWESERLQTQLECLVQVVSDATKTEYRLPMRFADVADVGGIPDRHPRNALVKIDAGKLTFVNNCIVLAETAVDISSADNCIIVAGLNVNISSADNCIVIAGRDATITSGNKSIILSGGSLSSSIIRESVLGCEGDIRSSIPHGSSILNPSKEQRAAIEAEQARFAERRPDRLTKFVESPGVVLEVEPPHNPLKDVIQITAAINLAPEPVVLFRRKAGDGEYVARANKEICFPDAKPIPELAGWKLVYCGGGAKAHAVFRKAEEVAVMDVSR